MPPLPLTTLLQTSLPELSTRTRAILSTLGCYNGDVPSAGEVAALVGMRSRFQLARALRQDGLPPFEELAGWARVLYWLFEAERSTASLRLLARRDQLDASTAYRLVHRVTRLHWSELHRLGLAAALRRFRERCTVNGRRGRAVRAEGNGRGHRSPVTPPRLARDHPVLRLGDGALAGVSVSAACPRRSHPCGVLAARLTVDGNPFDVALNSAGVACVTRTQAAAVEVLALAPIRALGSVRTGAVPTRVVFNRAGNLAYITSQFAEEVGVVELERLSQVSAIRVPGHPMAAALSIDERTLYVTTNLDRLCAVTLATGRVACSIPVPQICTELALDSSGRRLYVPTWRAGSILEVDARTLRVVRRFDVGGKVQGLALPSDGSTLFAANEGGWLDVIQLQTGRRITRLDLGSTAFGIALSPDDAVVYASLLYSGLVVIVDPHVLSVKTSLHVGGKPRRICFDAWGSMALVANEEGWVDLVR